jgi:6-phosphogluconolactonase
MMYPRRLFAATLFRAKGSGLRLRPARIALAITLAALLGAGCEHGHGWRRPAQSSTAPKREFLYVADYSASTIESRAIDMTSGRLTATEDGGSRPAGGYFPMNVAIEPAGHFLYVVNNQALSGSNSGSISAFSIDPRAGTLSAVPGSPFAAGAQPVAMTLHPSGHFLYVANASSYVVGQKTDGTISAFSIDRRTGTLRPLDGSPFAAAASHPALMATDPDGNFLYVANNRHVVRMQGRMQDSITIFSIDSSGRLTPLGGDSTVRANSARGMVVTSSGFLYATDYHDSAVNAFSVASNGALKPVPGSPFACASKPRGISADNSGRFLFAASGYGAKGLHAAISAFSIDTTTGALKPLAGSPYEAGVDATRVAVDPAGRFLYVSNSDEGHVTAFAIDSASGRLKWVAMPPFGGEPRALATVGFQ